MISASGSFSLESQGNIDERVLVQVEWGGDSPKTSAYSPEPFDVVHA
jgi:hypothetical protein